VPIPNYGGYGGLAIDGNGTAWFGGLRSLFCYAAGQPIRDFQLDQHSQPSNFRAAPDGSVWFAEVGLGRLGRIGRDGVLTERQLDRGDPAFWDIGVGPDGSVWYATGAGAGNGVARLHPDGKLTTYPVPDAASITVDSHGNAWIPQWTNNRVARVSNTGEVLEFTVHAGVRQLTEAPDGHMWFLDIGCQAKHQIGWIDASGQVKLFDAPIVDDSAAPNEMYRAPDGAVWFGTIDGRLIRLASETDVTVYDLPWPGTRIGTFIVLPANRVLIMGYSHPMHVANRQVLDFTALNGTPLAGNQGMPDPLAHVADDAAEAVAYKATLEGSGAYTKVDLLDSWKGTHAALFEYMVNQNFCNGSTLFVYVVEDSGGWRKYDAFTGNGYPVPKPSAVILLEFQTGCMNVHQSPSLGSQVLSCLPSGTTVNVYDIPVYADGYLWWAISSHDNPPKPLGWAVQNFLLCTHYQIGRLPQC
jgi:hypothetical protein